MNESEWVIGSRRGERCDQVIEGIEEAADLMNGRTGAEGQLSVDRAVTDRGAGERPGGGLRRDVKRGDNSGLQRMGGNKPEHQHT